MKRLVYSLVLSIILMMSATLNVFAMPYNPNNYTSVGEISERLAPGIKQSRVSEGTKTRGDFFMRADLIIKDDGGGNIGVIAVGYTNVPVEEAYITVYLDRYDEKTEKWTQVNSYESEFYLKDYPEGITTPTVDVTFTNNKKGYYYRSRAVLAVVHDGKLEGFSPITEGILIE